MHLRRSTFIRGLVVTGGVTMGQLLMSLGMPTTWHFKPLSFAFTLFISGSIGLNLAFLAAWIVPLLDPRYDADGIPKRRTPR